MAIDCWRPTKAQLSAARGKKVPDLIAPGLKILFVGINPGLYSAAIGHHFGRPGNRFWPALFASGLTPRLFSPFEETKLLKRGIGIVNIVDRATVGSAELDAEEFKEGAKRLNRKLLRFRPKLAAMLGIEPFKIAYGRPKPTLGPQDVTIGGTRLWLLPNPSGLNAHFQIPDLARLFRALGRSATSSPRREPGPRKSGTP